MEQRPLRLGDILDDYCPRERRVTNHAIVAMIEEDVRQTRCTTCDTEHAYKGAKVPRRRKKDETPSSLYKEVLAGLTETEAPPVVGAPALPVPAALAAQEDAPPQPAEEPLAVAPGDEPEPEPVLEEGPVHRPLIRATLPRPEGQKDARPIPDFTMRQPIGRANGRFRGGDARMRSRGNGTVDGNRGPGGPRFGPRPGGAGGRGPGGGFRSGQPRPGGGGRKRSR